VVPLLLSRPDHADEKQCNTESQKSYPSTHYTHGLNLSTTTPRIKNTALTPMPTITILVVILLPEKSASNGTKTASITPVSRKNSPIISLTAFFPITLYNPANSLLGPQRATATVVNPTTLTPAAAVRATASPAWDEASVPASSPGREVWEPPAGPFPAEAFLPGAA